MTFAKVYLDFMQIPRLIMDGNWNISLPLLHKDKPTRESLRNKTNSEARSLFWVVGFSKVVIFCNYFLFWIVRDALALVQSCKMNARSWLPQLDESFHSSTFKPVVMTTSKFSYLFSRPSYDYWTPLKPEILQSSRRYFVQSSRPYFVHFCG